MGQLILGDPGADSGARESRNGKKKEWAKKGQGQNEKLLVLPSLFFLPVPTFPCPTFCPWVSDDAGSYGVLQSHVLVISSIRFPR